MNAERRKSLKLLAPYQRQIIFEGEGSPEELSEEIREEMETLQTLENGMILMEWLELRGRAAQLGLFVDWSEPKTDELLVGEGRNWIRKEMSELRLAIRKERNERWQFWELRLKVLAQVAIALTGVIGATIGLVATLLK